MDETAILDHKFGKLVVDRRKIPQEIVLHKEAANHTAQQGGRMAPPAVPPARGCRGMCKGTSAQTFLGVQKKKSSAQDMARGHPHYSTTLPRHMTCLETRPTTVTHRAQHGAQLCNVSSTLSRDFGK